MKNKKVVKIKYLILLLWALPFEFLMKICDIKIPYKTGKETHKITKIRAQLYKALLAQQLFVSGQNVNCSSKYNI